MNTMTTVSYTHLEVYKRQAYAHHPIVGDTVYGPKKQAFNVEGQMLHAGVLGFVHPSSGEYMEFSYPLPRYFEDILNKLREMCIRDRAGCGQPVSKINNLIKRYEETKKMVKQFSNPKAMKRNKMFRGLF